MKAVIVIIALVVGTLGQADNCQVVASDCPAGYENTCWCKLECPEGQTRWGDGSACSGGGKPTCDLGYCANNPNGYPPCAPATCVAGTACAAPYQGCPASHAHRCYCELYCPVGLTRYGDGSACRGNGVYCDLGYCENNPNGGMPRCEDPCPNTPFSTPTPPTPTPPTPAPPTPAPPTPAPPTPTPPTPAPPTPTPPTPTPPTPTPPTPTPPTPTPPTPTPPTPTPPTPAPPTPPPECSTLSYSECAAASYCDAAPLVDISFADANVELGLAYIKTTGELGTRSDDETDAFSSEVRLFEVAGSDLNELLPHQVHQRIRDQGNGLFSHWKGSIRMAPFGNTGHPGSKQYKYTLEAEICKPKACDTADPALCAALPQCEAATLQPLPLSNLVSDGGFAYRITSTVPNPDYSGAGSVSKMRIVEFATGRRPTALIPHQIHQRIRDQGRGLFSHWGTEGSSSNQVYLASYSNLSPAAGFTYQYSNEGFICRTPPTPNPAACTAACLRFQCGTAGTLHDITVTGVIDGQVWGSSAFTDDSSVGAAAVHAGKIAVGETKALSVRCVGPLSSFTGASAHGVTTASYSGEWPAFSFDLEGATPAPTPSAPARCVNEPCVLNKCVVQGSKRALVVTGTTTGGVWGFPIFTDDSSVGAAAVLQGLGNAGDQISVVVSCLPGQDSYAAHTANGVSASAFGHWQFSYRLSAGAPIPTTETTAECDGACLDGSCPGGDVFRLRVTGTDYGYVWGTGTYTWDSTVGAAASHSGVVAIGTTAEVLVTCKGAGASFTGSTQNGVTTQSYGAWPGSYSLSPAPAQPTYVPCTGACVHNKCHGRGEVFHLTVTGSTGATIWGTGIYTSDSDVGVALVHAGRLDVGQTGNVRVVCTGSQSSYEATESNGISSRSYAIFPTSWAVMLD